MAVAVAVAAAAKCATASPVRGRMGRPTAVVAAAAVATTQVEAQSMGVEGVHAGIPTSQYFRTGS